MQRAWLPCSICSSSSLSLSRLSLCLPNVTWPPSERTTLLQTARNRSPPRHTRSFLALLLRPCPPRRASSLPQPRHCRAHASASALQPPVAQRSAARPCRSRACRGRERRLQHWLLRRHEGRARVPDHCQAGAAAVAAAVIAVVPTTRVHHHGQVWRQRAQPQPQP